MKMFAWLPAFAFLSACLVTSSSAFATGADYDGNGFAEIPVITTSPEGTLAWELFDPLSGKTSLFTSGLGRSGDQLILANWIYSKVTSAGALSKPTQQSGGRLVWTIRTLVRKNGRSSVLEHRKFLGRRGEIIITGGDFNGDGFADALVLTNRGAGKYTWGLRGNFFQSSYNPGLNQNRAYFPFGRWGVDKPFFLNPDGKRDWFAVLSCTASSTCSVVLTQPFTQQTRSFSVGPVADPSRVPIPVGQDDGTDLLGFVSDTGASTSITFKNLRGATVRSVTVPLQGTVTVGNYGPGPGEEVCVSANGNFVVLNPITGRSTTLSGPVGLAADSININTIF